MTEDTLDLELLEAVAPETTGRRLFEIRLPAEDQRSICISSTYRNGAQRVLDPNLWLSSGHDGVRIIGEGPSPTHLFCDSHDGITLWASQHRGVVRLENVHLHAGFRCAAQVGEPNHARVLMSEFRLELAGCQVTVPPPTVFGRTKWGLFTYQCDLFLEDVVIDAYHASEHASYQHQYARHGAWFNRVHVVASGAECLKSRGDAFETMWAGPRARIVVKNSTFAGWYQLHSDRGGAAIVLQGAAADLLVQDSIFWGGGPLGSLPAHLRSRAIMVSSENASYNKFTGEIGTGVGNGHVVVQRCGVFGGPGAPDWSSSELIRVGRNSGSQRAAQAVLVDGCAIYGLREHVMAKDLSGRFLVQNCNTPDIRERASALGADTTNEAAVLTSVRPVPISEGFDSRPARLDPAQ
jgi:hypothetical protein